MAVQRFAPGEAATRRSSSGSPRHGPAAPAGAPPPLAKGEGSFDKSAPLLAASLCRPASIAPLLAVLSCVLYCLNGELLQALQLHTPASERHASVGVNLVLCHLGGLAFAPSFLLSTDFGPPSAAAGLMSNTVTSLSGMMAQRPRLSALLFAWVLMGYNYAWLSSTRFVTAAVTNAVFQTSAALVYAASVPLFGEPLTQSRFLGVGFMLLGSALASGLASDYSVFAGSGSQGAVGASVAASAGIGVSLALLAAMGMAIYQVLFRHVFGHLKGDVRFLAFFSAWVSTWHVVSVLPALYLASYFGLVEKLEWPRGTHAVLGTAVSAGIASTVNALYLCIALWGSVMLLPCVSALSVPLTVALDAALHGVVPGRAEVVGHTLVVFAVVLLMDLLARIPALSLLGGGGARQRGRFAAATDV